MKKTQLIAIVSIIVIAIVIYAVTQSRTSSPTASTTPTTNTSMQQQNGLQIETITPGTGAEAKAGDTVVVHYTGILTDGTKFDSSIDRGMPFTFKLGAHQVIPGWEMGVLGMKVGEKRKLVIPPELAYGNSGVGNIIPPQATLIFQIELISIQ